MEKLAWLLVSILGVATVLLVFTARLLYAQGERWHRAFLDLKKNIASHRAALQARVDELETENEVLRDLTQAQAERAEAYGINDPVMVRHSDGHSYPQNTYIHEQP